MLLAVSHPATAHRRGLGLRYGRAQDLGLCIAKARDDQALAAAAVRERDLAEVASRCRFPCGRGRLRCGEVATYLCCLRLIRGGLRGKARAFRKGFDKCRVGIRGVDECLRRAFVISGLVVLNLRVGGGITRSNISAKAAQCNAKAASSFGKIEVRGFLLCLSKYLVEVFAGGHLAFGAARPAEHIVLHAFTPLPLGDRHARRVKHGRALAATFRRFACGCLGNGRGLADRHVASKLARFLCAPLAGLAVGALIELVD